MTSGSGTGLAGSPHPSPRRPHRVFDRERPPHDWRWIVGGVGKVLIVIGLLMFAFVAYQLWGTGIYTAQAQNRLDLDFDDLGIPAATTVVPTTSVTAPTTDVSTTVPGTASPAVSTAPAPSTQPATSVAPTTTLGGAVPFPFALPASGKVLARLQIPGIGVDYKVVEGVGLDDLAQGPGHFPESALPGQLGNTAIAGHRTTHGAPFYDVDKLHPGDQIIVTYPKIGELSGPRFVYSVTGTKVVSPSAYAAVVPTTDASKATLVLASCTPIRSASKRIIISAELDLSVSSPIFAPTPRPAAAPGATIPGDDNVSSTASATTVTGAVITTTASTATTAADGASTATGTTATGDTIGTTVAGTTSTSDTATSDTATSDTATTDTATGDTAGTTVAGVGPVVTAPPSTGAGTDPANPPTASQDAFAGGWFNDSAAWPDIALWGLALALIAYAGYRLAKWQRRIWLGTLAAFVPFVPVLYFFFENINRLLPPGL